MSIACIDYAIRMFELLRDDLMMDAPNSVPSIARVNRQIELMELARTNELDLMHSIETEREIDFEELNIQEYHG